MPVRHIIPPLTNLLAADLPTAPSPVHSITTSTSTSMSAASPGVIAGAELLDKITFCASRRDVGDVHLVAALHTKPGRP
jgi:hypothetical protein